MRSLTVVVPTKDAPALPGCLGSFLDSTVQPDELILVDSSSKETIVPEAVADAIPTRVVRRIVTQLQAKSLGAYLATSDRVCFVDSDQRATAGLVGELKSMHESIIAVPERPVGGGLLPKIIYLHGRFLWTQFQGHPSWSLPVIPRCFDRATLLRGLDSLHAIYGNLSVVPHLHEDSVLFAHVMRRPRTPSSALGFANEELLHLVDGLGAAFRKSYRYGWEKGARRLDVGSGGRGLAPADRALINSLDAYRWRPYFGPWVNVAGMLYDGFRVPAFAAGLLRGRSATSILERIDSYRYHDETRDGPDGNRPQ